MTILFCLGSLLIGALIIYLILRPKLKQTKVYDLEIEQLNNQLYADKELLTQEKNQLIGQKSQLCQEVTEVEKTLSGLNSRREEIKLSIVDLEAQAKKSGEVFYQNAIDTAQINIEHSLEKISNEYSTATNQYQQEYLNTLNDSVQSFQEQIAEKTLELASLDAQIKQETAKVRAFIDANKRAEEIRTQADYYKLNIPEEDMKEIEQLRSVEKYLRNAEPLNKVIWKCYYEKPYTDLVGRVIGQGTHTGIYKITNLKNGMCYVGQAASLSERWRQHIRRGLGAEPVTRNKLYPAMKKEGVENFSFEVIEECDRASLDAREDYWQKHFGALEYGYSIK